MLECTTTRSGLNYKVLGEMSETGCATETEVISDSQMVLQMLWRTVSVWRNLQLEM